MYNKQYMAVGLFLVVMLSLMGYYVVSKPDAATVAAQRGAFDGVTAIATSSPSSSLSSSTPDTVSESAVQPPNTKKYESTLYHISLFYPDDLDASEKPLKSNSMIIAFKGTAAKSGFQIFVTPYNEPKISQKRFLQDEPSGVMNNPANITINGVSATEFYSTNDAMGATREIWFLRGGWLYEITAPQSLDSWLLQIMETLRFS